MKTKVETITPEEAEGLLKSNTRNRSMRKRIVDKIARDISAGKYHLTHQPIGIAPSFIVDGQHRLAAILQSNIPVLMNVTRYDSDEEGEAALIVVDKGTARTDADVLVISKILAFREGRILTPVMRHIMRTGMLNTSVNNPSSDELASLYLKERHHFDWVASCVIDPDAPRRFNTAQRAAFFCGHTIDEASTEALLSDVLSSDKSSSAVALAYQKAASQGRFMQSNKPQIHEQFYLALRYIQAEFLGEDATKKIRGTPATATWFRERIAEKRHLVLEVNTGT